jgi:hypothetical protein
LLALEQLVVGDELALEARPGGNAVDWDRPVDRQVHGQAQSLAAVFGIVMTDTVEAAFKRELERIGREFAGAKR